MAKNQYTGNVLSRPRWAGDYLSDESLMPTPYRLDPAQFTDQAGIVVTVDVAGAAQSATSIPVVAITLPNQAAQAAIAAGSVMIPAGRNLWFGGTKFAHVTADVLLGATTISVAALPTALVSGDVATFSRFGAAAVRSGTVVGRTLAERDAGTNFGPAAVGDDEIFIVAFDKPDLSRDSDFEAYKPHAGKVVYENFLPDYSGGLLLGTGANEVQTVAVDTILSGGKIGLTAVDSAGVPQTVVVSYNTSWTQTVADIQTALVAVLGTAAVAAAVTATKNMTLTFSGAGYAGKAQPPVGVDISAATGPTKATVTRTTPGGTPVLTRLRQLYNCQVAEA